MLSYYPLTMLFSSQTWSLFPSTKSIMPFFRTVSDDGLSMYWPSSCLIPRMLIPVLSLIWSSPIVLLVLEFISEHEISKSETSPIRWSNIFSTNSWMSGYITSLAIFCPPTLSGMITLVAPASFNFLSLAMDDARLIIIRSGFISRAVITTNRLSASLAKALISAFAFSIPALWRTLSSVASPSI